MGCGQSKCDRKLITFCKDRKDLIKASRDSWHSLSHAHMAYVQSLQNVGNGITNFTIEGLVIRFKSPLDTISVNQTVEVVPQSNDSSLESTEDDGDLDSSHVGMNDASDVFSEEEPSTFLEQPETPPSNTTSFIDLPHNRNQAPSDEFVHNMHGPSNFIDQQIRFPVPEDTTCEDITPFNSFEEYFLNLYFHGSYETNLEDINEVGEYERIPNLDDEQHDLFVEVFSTEEESHADLSDDSKDSLSNEASNNGYDFCLNETEVKEASERRYSCPQVDESEQNATPTPIYSLTNLHEVLACIKEVFDTILIHGKDVSEMLKPFEPHITLIKNSTSKGTSMLGRMLLQNRTYTKLKYDYNDEYGKEANTNSCNLSWTMEKLYTWEKKLYDELKEEEKLRKIFQKELAKLKKLESNGAELVKSDASQYALKKVAPKMNVSLSKIGRISTKIHGIEHDELQPLLCEYIRGLQKLSKIASQSQQKQVQAFTNSLENIDSVTCMTSPSSQRATKKLEKEVIKLEKIIFGWIKSHKEFVVLLKKWLLKFQEHNEVPDSNSLNTYTICDDWLKALEEFSDVDLRGALKSLVEILHQLSENLHEERCHRLRLQHFWNYHEQKLKRLCKENGVDYEICKFLYREAELVGGISGDSSLAALYVRMGPILEKVHEASAKHEEAMNRVNNTARGVLEKGIVPVLVALERFNMEVFVMYEQVRVLNE